MLFHFSPSTLSQIFESVFPPSFLLFFFSVSYLSFALFILFSLYFFILNSLSNPFSLSYLHSQSHPFLLVLGIHFFSLYLVFFFHFLILFYLSIRFYSFLLYFLFPSIFLAFVCLLFLSFSLFFLFRCPPALISPISSSFPYVSHPLFLLPTVIPPSNCNSPLLFSSSYVFIIHFLLSSSFSTSFQSHSPFLSLLFSSHPIFLLYTSFIFSLLVLPISSIS